VELDNYKPLLTDRLIQQFLYVSDLLSVVEAKDAAAPPSQNFLGTVD